MVTSRYLEFVVTFTGGIPCIIEEDFALFVGKNIPDTPSLAIFVPGTLSLVGRTSGAPREPCRVRVTKCVVNKLQDLYLSLRWVCLNVSADQEVARSKPYCMSLWIKVSFILIDY